MRLMLGLSMIVAATPVAWQLNHYASKPCDVEGKVVVGERDMAICHKGVWQKGPLDSSRLLEITIHQP